MARPVTLSSEKFFIMKDTQRNGSSTTPWILNSCTSDAPIKCGNMSSEVEWEHSSSLCFCERNTGGRQRGQRKGTQDWSDRGGGLGFTVLGAAERRWAGAGAACLSPKAFSKRLCLLHLLSGLLPAVERLLWWEFPGVAWRRVKWPFQVKRSSFKVELVHQFLNGISSLLMYSGWIQVYFRPRRTHEDYTIKERMSLKSPVFWVIFLTYHFEGVFDIEIRGKDSTENSCIPFTQLPLMLTCYITLIQWSKLAELALLQYY